MCNKNRINCLDTSNPHKMTSLSPQRSSCSPFANTTGYVTELSGRRSAPTASFQVFFQNIVTPVSNNICVSHCSIQPLIESAVLVARLSIPFTHWPSETHGCSRLVTQWWQFLPKLPRSLHLQHTDGPLPCCCQGLWVCPTSWSPLRVQRRAAVSISCRTWRAEPWSWSEGCRIVSSYSAFVSAGFSVGSATVQDSAATCFSCSHFWAAFTASCACANSSAFSSIYGFSFLRASWMVGKWIPWTN